MKKTALYTSLVLMLSIFTFGQDQKQAPMSTSEMGGGIRGSGSLAAIDSGTRIDGQLQSTVDVKKSKVGDEVVLKTTKAIKQGGRTIVPKGARLFGRVTEVQEKTRSNGVSKLGMVFDRIEGKDLAGPINASIVSITSVMANSWVADSADSDIFASSNSSARGSGGGGGLLSGTAGSVANAGGGLLNTTTRAVGNVTNSVGHTASNAGGSLIRTVDGVAISNSIDGSVQSGSTLSAADKNIKLEKGLIVGLMLNSSVRSQ